MTEKEARIQAKKEAEFYTHLATFLVVMTGLTAVNLLFSPGHYWFVYPLLGWGMGLGGHASEVFQFGRGPQWQQQRAQELMDHKPSEERLRALLDETLDERAVPTGAPQDVERLQRRIEHLEAIVTSRDWDEVAIPLNPVPETPALDLDALDEHAVSPETEAARLARRVR